MISGLVEWPDRLTGEPERANSSPDSGRPVSAGPFVTVHAAGGIRKLTARRTALKGAILTTSYPEFPLAPIWPTVTVHAAEGIRELTARRTALKGAILTT